ncbi:hypothetical protein PILCRDRAFT_494211 [Piloderma croceum F 1598]|uniref:Uncharacterized protein n=1 Tax=Piloderma croceum (strain F 1598) TaxID=765440 RepID=A0A0C3BVT7_PILCF|nr:hypothetical protein PILCRDRAFT_494211 [Piloderma croceum F 1598]
MILDGAIGPGMKRFSNILTYCTQVPNNMKMDASWEGLPCTYDVALRSGMASIEALHLFSVLCCRF